MLGIQKAYLYLIGYIRTQTVLENSQIIEVGPLGVHV